MKNKQKDLDMTLLPSALLLGILASMTTTLSLTALMAYLMAGERVGEDNLNLVAVVVLITSAAFGAMCAFRRLRHRRLLICLTSGGVYFLVLVACNALLFEGTYHYMGITALAVAGGSSAAALLGLRGGHGTYKQRRTKYHNMKIVQNRQRGN